VYGEKSWVSVVHNGTVKREKLVLHTELLHCLKTPPFPLQG